MDQEGEVRLQQEAVHVYTLPLLFSSNARVVLDPTLVNLAHASRLFCGGLECYGWSIQQMGDVAAPDVPKLGPPMVLNRRIHKLPRVKKF